jgi:hypothetical protein
MVRLKRAQLRLSNGTIKQSGSIGTKEYCTSNKNVDEWDFASELSSELEVKTSRGGRIVSLETAGRSERHIDRDPSNF